MGEAPYFEGYIRNSFIKPPVRVYVLIYKMSLVICYVSHEEMAAEKKRIKTRMKTAHISWMERPEFLRAELIEYGARFARMDKKAALAQSENNREISYADIEKIRYSHASEDCDGEMNILCLGRLMIKTAQSTITILHNLEESAPQEQELRRGLRQIDT